MLAAALVAGIAVWFATTANTSDTTRFTVWNHAASAVAYARPVAIGETFTLEHTHSVTERLVVETFSVHDASTIALEELWFDEFGPNLPTSAEQVGEHATFLQEDGAFRVLHHGHPIGSVPLLVGSPSVDHVLRFEDGTSVRLLDVAPARSRVELLVGGGP